MKNFRTLELAMKFYQNFKNVKLSGAMKNQFERSLLSIVLNLSEGSAKPIAKPIAKPTAKDRAHY